MNDLTFEEASEAAFRRQAEAIGADWTNPETIGAVSDQLLFLRNNPAREEDQADGESTFKVWTTWGCEAEAAIIVGRLASRGWVLVRKT